MWGRRNSVNVCLFSSISSVDICMCGSCSGVSSFKSNLGLLTFQNLAVTLKLCVLKFAVALKILLPCHFVAVCNMNVHKRCQKNVANNCGINTKEMAQILAAMGISTDKLGPPPRKPNKVSCTPFCNLWSSG